MVRRRGEDSLAERRPDRHVHAARDRERSAVRRHLGRFPALFGTVANADPTNPYDSSSYTFDGTGTPFGSPGREERSRRRTAPGTRRATRSRSRPTARPRRAFSLGAPAGGSFVGTGITVSAAPTDAESGLRQVDFFYCDTNGGPCVPSISIGTGTPVARRLLGQLEHARADRRPSVRARRGRDRQRRAHDDLGAHHRDRRQQRAARCDGTPPRDGNAFQSYDAANKRLWLNATQSGSFKLRATASDPIRASRRSPSRRCSAPARTPERSTQAPTSRAPTRSTRRPRRARSRSAPRTVSRTRRRRQRATRSTSRSTAPRRQQPRRSR